MSASEAAESSSRAGHRDVDAEPVPQPPQRQWYALASNVVILDHGDERIQEIPRGTDVKLDLHGPPSPSFLWLLPRNTQDPGDSAQKPSAYILAADRSGRLLFRVTDTATSRVPIMYLCDVHTRKASSLPPIPLSHLNIDNEQPGRSIGLIADPTQRGEYLVVRLFPRPSPFLADRLLCYSTAMLQWSFKTLASSPASMRDPCAEDGMLAHVGRLWWLALAYGVFVCDPFASRPHLGFVALPDDRVTQTEPAHIHRRLIAQRRHVGPSEGDLRYVEVKGLSYQVSVPPSQRPPVNPSVAMWTLLDQETEVPGRWKFEYEVTFADIWAHQSYVDAQLPQGEVPHVAFVDPHNHGVVYFLLASKIFGLDVEARKVVSCQNCPVRDDRPILFRHSRPIIDAWELLPPSRDPSSSSSDDEPPRQLSFDELLKDVQATKKVNAWLSELDTSETDKGQSSSG